MADPLSITGLLLQVGALTKQLYDYGKQVKGAQQQIAGLFSELCALKGVLSNIEDAQGAAGGVQADPELAGMLSTAHSILDTLADRLGARSTARGRTIQSLRWPFDKAGYTDTLLKLERLKSCFVLYLVGDQRTMNEALKDGLAGLTDMVKNDITRREDRATRDTTQALLKALAPVSPEAVHNKACALWQGTTFGSWFLDGAFKDWIEADRPDNRILLLTGISGCGKTTLLSGTAEQAMQQNVVVAKSYCTFNNARSQELKTVLGCWIAQLALSDPSILDDLLNRFHPNQPKMEQVSIQELEAVIVRASTGNSPLLLVVDALNESSESRQIGESIMRLVSASSHVRCIASATPHFSGMPEGTGSCQEITLRPQDVLQDIEAYIDSQITEHDILQSIPRAVIMHALLYHADGMFRWVDCQMHYLIDQRSRKLALRALQSLPGNLNDTYTAILMRIPQTCRNLAKEALMWLTFAHRPLTLAELNEAAVIEESDEDIDDDCRLQPRDTLLALCQGLVSWDSESDIVALAHNSVLTYLTSEHILSTSAASFHLQEEHSARSIVRRAVTYLLMRPFSVGMVADKTLYQLHEDYPLLDYASTAWPLHAAGCQLGETEHSLIETLFLTHRRVRSGGSFTFWVRTLLATYETDAVRAAEPLYYAASYGLTTVVDRMLTKGLVSNVPLTGKWYIDHQCGRAASTALQVACYRGYPAVVFLLLKAGADPDSTDCEGITCLHWADTFGHEGCAELLRHYGATVNDNAFGDAGEGFANTSSHDDQLAFEIDEVARSPLTDMIDQRYRWKTVQMPYRGNHAP